LWKVSNVGTEPLAGDASNMEHPTIHLDDRRPSSRRGRIRRLPVLRRKIGIVGIATILQ
jgi:hypothetical protein